MKYEVNENCIGCGLCISICPDYFTMADTGQAVALEAPVPTGHENEAEYAAGSCPVGAIEEAAD
ncbi:MAG: ferredoxin [Agathobacter sp.]|nr:ferredoxin [Agathobacter sp.]